MKGVLSDNKLNYVLFHLNMHFDLSLVAERFHFTTNRDHMVTGSGKIHFVLSSEEYKEERVIYKDDLTILFPADGNEPVYSIKDGSLVFHHDLLKSAFFLLSGWQEFVSREKDAFGRFPYDRSVQKKFEFIDKPLVNYFFSKIIEGIEEFCLINGITINKHKLFESYGFMLTHDIDHIDAYSIRTVGYKLKQFLGLAPAYHDPKKTLKIFIRDLYRAVNPFYNENPFWKFKEFIREEKRLGLRSVFFFLNVDREGGSVYSLQEQRIRNVIECIHKENFEVGLHGTMESAVNLSELVSDKNIIEGIMGEDIMGVRQHCLHFNFPGTMSIYEDSGLKYDSTLGFAAHEGFRNSYCHPFKLYDFKNERAFEVWEYPLNVMDTTLFGYRKLHFSSAKSNIIKLIREIRKFGGIFTLLWHNDFFDEDRFPGVTRFYYDLLEIIADDNPENVLGKEILKRLEPYNQDVNYIMGKIN